MANVDGSRERIEQVITMFKNGGAKFTSNVSIPLKAAKALNDESNTPATKQIMEQCQAIVDNDAKSVEVLFKEIATTLGKAMDEMDKMGVLKK